MLIRFILFFGYFVGLLFSSTLNASSADNFWYYAKDGFPYKPYCNYASSHAMTIVKTGSLEKKTGIYGVCVRSESVIGRITNAGAIADARIEIKKTASNHDSDFLGSTITIWTSKGVLATVASFPHMSSRQECTSLGASRPLPGFRRKESCSGPTCATLKGAQQTRTCRTIKAHKFDEGLRYREMTKWIMQYNGDLLRSNYDSNYDFDPYVSQDDGKSLPSASFVYINRNHPLCTGGLRLYGAGGVPLSVCDYIRVNYLKDRAKSEREETFSIGEVFDSSPKRFIVAEEGIYHHDDKGPICKDPEAWYSQSGTTFVKGEEYKGGWTYRDVYFRGKCSDVYRDKNNIWNQILSGCKNPGENQYSVEFENTTKKKVFAGKTFQTSFEDQVGNIGNPHCQKEIYVDKIPPLFTEWKMTYPSDSSNNDIGHDEIVSTGSVINANSDASYTSPAVRSGIDTNRRDIYTDTITLSFNVTEAEIGESSTKEVTMTTVRYSCSGSHIDDAIGEAKVKKLHQEATAKSSWESDGKTPRARQMLSFNEKINQMETPGCYKITVKATDFAGNRSDRSFLFKVVPNPQELIISDDDDGRIVTGIPISWPADPKKAIQTHNPDESNPSRARDADIASCIEKCVNEDDYEPGTCEDKCIDSNVETSVTPSGGEGSTETATTVTDDPKYANNDDAVSYGLCITDKYGNPIVQKKFWDIEHAKRSPNIMPDASFTGVNYPLQYHIQNGNKKGEVVTDKKGCINFKVTSYVPGEFDNRFSVKYFDWDTTYQDKANDKNNSDYVKTATLPKNGPQKISFKKPYRVDMDFASGGVVDRDPATARLNIGANNEIKFTETLGGGAGKIDTSTVRVYTKPPHHVEVPAGVVPYKFFGKQNKENSNPIPGCDNPSLDIRSICFFVQALRNITADDELNARSKPYISYSFKNDGVKVSYRLTKEHDTTGTGYVTLSGGTLNGIYIGGQQRSDGKEGIVSNMESIDALKGFNYRDAIRKQVALATRNRTPDNKVVGGVYYAKGNVKLSKIQNEWRTIIVEDGNLIIDQDISDRSKTYGIIVLRTGDDDSTGNIYITPSVTKINANMIADGSIQSVNPSGEPFSESGLHRTGLLKKQLMIYGSIFSRNTIGGAVLVEQGSTYVLPGGEPTKDLHKAVKYDLSFLRMYNYGSDGSPWSKNNGDKKWHKGHSESTVVIPNPNFLTNPPPVFNFKE